jgi:hypothetical protein
MRRLIVNADDLGRSPGVNEGILRAHEAGIVTSASLLVGFPASAAGAERARNAPTLGVGLHLALTGAPALLARSEIPGLLDASGRLPRRPEAGLDGVPEAELRAEARAQLRRFRELMGHGPTHVDSHHHAHRIPAVERILLELAREAGCAVRSTSPEMAARVRAAGVATPDRFCDVFWGDDAREETLAALLEELPDGVTELMCHPAVVDPELAAGSSYAAPRERELEILTRPRLRTRITQTGVQLVHFGQLPAPADSPV